MNTRKELYEVIIVDNNSTDNTAILCSSLHKSHPGTNWKYVVEKNQGVAFARTTGAKYAKGEIVSYIDDDCIAEKNWLNMVIDFYEYRHKDAMSTGGAITPLLYGIKYPKWYSKFFWGLVGNFNLGNQPLEMKGVRYPCGANMHFRRSVFEKYGYFDTNLGRSGESLNAGEEKAMYKKLRKAKEKVYYIPQATVRHHVCAYKFNQEYIKLHSMGIGGSERLMVQTWYQYAGKLSEYAAKFLYSVFYSILFLGEISKATMFVKFRWFVLEGFLKQAGIKTKIK